MPVSGLEKARGLLLTLQAVAYVSPSVMLFLTSPWVKSPGYTLTGPGSSSVAVCRAAASYGPILCLISSLPLIVSSSRLTTSLLLAVVSPVPSMEPA